MPHHLTTLPLYPSTQEACSQAVPAMCMNDLFATQDLSHIDRITNVVYSTRLETGTAIRRYTIIRASRLLVYVKMAEIDVSLLYILYFSGHKTTLVYFYFFFFFNNPAPPEFSPLPLPAPLPISAPSCPMRTPATSPLSGRALRSPSAVRRTSSGRSPGVGSSGSSSRVTSPRSPHSRRRHRTTRTISACTFRRTSRRACSIRSRRWACRRSGS